MKWILQTGIQDSGYLSLIEALTNRDLDFEIIKPVFGTNIIIDKDFDTFARQPTKEDDVFIDNTQAVFPFGVMGLSRISKERQWSPGSFENDQFTFENWAYGFGLDNILNEESQVVKFGDELNNNHSVFFARPCEDNKAFAGQMFTKEKFSAWQKKVMDVCNDLDKLNANTLITIAPYKEILQECRVMVIDKKVITASYYKFGAHVRYEEVKHGDPILSYAQDMVDKYQPARAFVVDIALTPDGYKVIEINNINTVGLYHMDVNKFIDAIEGFEV